MTIEDENLGSVVLDRIIEKLEELEDDDVFIESAVFAADLNLTRENVAHAKSVLHRAIATVSDYTL